MLRFFFCEDSKISGQSRAWRYLVHTHNHSTQMTPSPSHSRWNCSCLPGLQMKTSVLKVAGHLRRILQSSFWKLQVNLYLCTLEGTSDIISTHWSFPQIYWVLHHHQSRKSYGWVPLASQHQDPHQPVRNGANVGWNRKWWKGWKRIHLHHVFP